MTSSFILYIATATAMVLVIEGLIYALFPDRVRKMFEMALALPPEKLRAFGMVMAITGFVLIWLLQSFSNG